MAAVALGVVERGSGVIKTWRRLSAVLQKFQLQPTIRWSLVSRFFAGIVEVVALGVTECLFYRTFPINVRIFRA